MKNRLKSIYSNSISRAIRITPKMYRAKKYSHDGDTFHGGNQFKKKTLLKRVKGGFRADRRHSFRKSD